VAATTACTPRQVIKTHLQCRKRAGKEIDSGGGRWGREGPASDRAALLAVLRQRDAHLVTKGSSTKAERTLVWTDACVEVRVIV
jgi:hypothetical protein